MFCCLTASTARALLTKRTTAVHMAREENELCSYSRQYDMAVQVITGSHKPWRARFSPVCGPASPHKVSEKWRARFSPVCGPASPHKVSVRPSFPPQGQCAAQPPTRSVCGPASPHKVSVRPSFPPQGQCAAQLPPTRSVCGPASPHKVSVRPSFPPKVSVRPSFPPQGQ